MRPTTAAARNAVTRRLTPRRRRQLKLGLVRVRQWVAASAFDLPQLLIIGAMRAGTSSVFKYLAQHPAMQRSLRKEVDFFSHFYAQGEDWYRAHFPLQRRGLVSFEASPSYLLHPRAAERAARHVPAAQVLMLVRDPAERAYSHWKHMVRIGFEKETFRDGLRAERRRTEGAREALARGDIDRSLALERFSYASRGHYAADLLPWTRAFERSQIRVLRFEALIESPSDTLAAIHRFAGVPPQPPADLRNFSEVGRPDAYHRRVPRSADDERAIAELRSRYDADQEQLAPWLESARSGVVPAP